MAFIVNTSPYDDIDAHLTFYYWMGDSSALQDNQIPYVAREVFKYYMGEEQGLRLFKVMDDGFNGISIKDYMGKVTTFGDRQVKIFKGASTANIIIGKPGLKYDANWNVVK